MGPQEFGPHGEGHDPLRLGTASGARLDRAGHVEDAPQDDAATQNKD
jgi:hypothetical protein